ncbi:MAG: YdeI/OmpD-associated family protein [Bacteroidetes bacterium]|nr:YdeI/OmpD-associated family protein [Bacteroidota bacterium]MDA0903225.1 YdeI/OmpD-associated family protein [Bacteroidota bacterium]MDA1242216.1 YdeI/OmpD-associated family protein [Bacteroidota bacterium]
MKWNFQTRLERFEVGTNEQAWQHIVIPENVSKEIQQSGHTRFVLTLNGHTSWHCAVNVTCEADHQEAGISFVYVAKQHMRDAKCEPAAWVDVLLEVDNSKYGMDVHPALQAMLDDDPLFQKRFDAMLPGKRRGHLLQINKAKSPGTVAKRIAALMNELKLT